MKQISAQEAFYEAPPRSAAVLCIPQADGTTRMLLAEWFSWLNMKRQPMLSFSLKRDEGLVLHEDDKLYLAFPPVEQALLYREGFYVNAESKSRGIPETIPFGPKETRVPSGSEAVLCASLASSYNYPFKKVRIYNLNLEEAFKLIEDDE